MGKTFLVPSGAKLGEILSIKNSVVEDLVRIAEETTQRPVSPEGQLVLSRFIDGATRGYVANLGMICTGTKCAFLSACPLHAIGATLPVGKRCPVEGSLVVTWINKHLKSLGIEDPDDPVHSFDMDMLYELAGQELIRWRCSVHLSDDPRLVSNQQVGATQQGEPIFADVINPVLDVMDRAGRNIAKIREALVATREAQMKAGQVSTDPTQRAAELREKANKMLASRRKEQEVVREAEFKVKE